MESDGPAAPRARRQTRKLIIVLCVVILLMLTACILLFMQYRQAVKDQAKSVPASTNQLTNLLSKSIALPNEQVSIATVMDKTKLSQPQLAAEAENGDQLLVYAKSRRVILYRPSTKKVIDMFHITADQAEQPSGTNQGAPATKPQR